MVGIQRNTGSPISIVARYFLALLAEYIPTQGVAGGTCGYDAEVQTAKPQKERSWYLKGTEDQTPKRKELIFEKYRRPNPKNEGVDIWEVQTTKP